MDDRSNAGVEKSDCGTQDRLTVFASSFKYAVDNFEIGRQLNAGPKDFNKGVHALRRAAKNGLSGPISRAEFGIEVLILIDHETRKFGEPNLRVAFQADGAVNKAIQSLASKLSLIGGRPRDTLLEYHVSGIAALVQTHGGFHMAGLRYKDSVYNPQVSGTFGPFLVQQLRLVDPSVTTTAVANILERLRKTKALKGKLFRDFFPCFGGSIDGLNGHPIAEPGSRVEAFQAVL